MSEYYDHHTTKGSMSVGGQYADQFASPPRFVWQSQTSTHRDDLSGRIISGVEPGWTKPLESAAICSVF